MDVSSAGGTPKRNRSKGKPSEAAADSAAAKSANSRSRKAKGTGSEPATADSESVTVTAVTAIVTPSDDELLAMIATAAYFLAEQRNFEPGYELEDWLEAERQIRTLHT